MNVVDFFQYNINFQLVMNQNNATCCGHVLNMKYVVELDVPVNMCVKKAACVFNWLSKKLRSIL